MTQLQMFSSLSNGRGTAICIVSFADAPWYTFLELTTGTDTWENLSHLKQFKGYKRVENYIKSTYALEQRVLHERTSFSREDIEAFEIDRERRREQLDGFKTVERIIASRDAGPTADIDRDHGKEVCGRLFLQSTDWILLHFDSRVSVQMEGSRLRRGHLGRSRFHTANRWEGDRIVPRSDIGADSASSFSALYEKQTCLPCSCQAARLHCGWRRTEGFPDYWLELACLSMVSP
jgi:hypothetical protein